MTLYISRLMISRKPAAAALAQLIDPDDPGRRDDAHHRLIWSAFAGDPDQRRDFLWRADGRGCFIVLSRRPPGDSPLFDRFEVKEFSPDLAPGDRLTFKLRANATVTKKSSELAPNGKPRRQHHDIVMEALRDVASGPDRANRRMVLARQAAKSWLDGQSARHGFTAEDCVVEDYSVRALPSHRGARRGQPQFGVLDLIGIISVTDPEAFVDKLSQGFGRARAYGCGLMLIRRS